MAVTLPPPPAGHCFHCLQPLPADGGHSVTIQNQDYDVCCYGCQAVANTIAEHQLLHFYQYRDTSNPLQIPLLPDELTQLEAYDDPQLQAEISHTGPQPDQRQITLSVEGITCSACAWLIERELERLPGIVAVNMNASTERLNLTWQPAQVALSRVMQTVAGLGYRALPFQAAHQEYEFKQRRRYFMTRLGVAGLATMQVMMIAFALYFGVFTEIDPEIRDYLWWISLIFATPVLLYSAQPFYLSALRSIQAQRPNMDVPVSIALLGAYGASAYATVTGGGEVYFESVSMFTFLLLLGRYLELLAKQKALAAAANLVKLLPAIAQRENTSGTIENIAVHRLTPGDTLLVKAGTAIPADGELLSERAAINEGILTGESRPIDKHHGELLFAGSINQQHPIRMKVTAVQHETVLASIVRLQDIALSNKPKLAQTAENLANKFVTRLLLLAALTFIGWSFYDPAQAFWVTLAVLVATCPCALALAAPTAVTGAIHKLNKQGVLLRNADILSTLPLVRTVFFDKTGTLTTGEFSLQSHYCHHQSEWSATQQLQLIQQLEQYSQHPLAAPLQQLELCPAEPFQLMDVEEQQGYGLTATVTNQDRQVRLGSLRYIRQWHPQFCPHDQRSQVFLATPEYVLMELYVGDKLRSDVATMIQQLQGFGVEVELLTGDHSFAAHDIAVQLGIKKVHSECLPADKLAILAQAQQQHPVMMVGDGVNDGPVLAQADIAVTFSGAADLARTAADVVLLNTDAQTLLRFWSTARKGQRIMRQNISWALLYNAIIIPVAVAGFITPYWAALGMSASSLLVLLNSLRLYR